MNLAVWLVAYTQPACVGVTVNRIRCSLLFIVVYALRACGEVAIEYHSFLTRPYIKASDSFMLCPLHPGGKVNPSYWMWLGGLQNWSGEVERHLPLPRIEQAFLGCLASNIMTILNTIVKLSHIFGIQLISQRFQIFFGPPPPLVPYTHPQRPPTFF